MTKKKQEELEMMAMEETTALAADEDAALDASVAQDDGATVGEDLNELLTAMDGEEQPETESEPLVLPENEAISENGDFEEQAAGEPLPDENAPPESPPKPKRATRKKKSEDTPPAEEESPTQEEPTAESKPPVEMEPPVKDAAPEPEKTAAPVKRATRRKAVAAPILTIDARGEAETQENVEDTIWHEIHNAYRTRKMLTGYLGGVEQTDNGKTIAIVEYKGFRVVIPLKEMMINLGGDTASGAEYDELMRRQNKVLSNMLGAEIDFIVKGIDSKTRSVVASRKDAMLKKRQLFYLNTDAAGMYRIYEGRVVQARVIAVAEKVIRVEVFGAECSILARDLSWDWIGDAHERFSIGDQILVRVLSVKRESLENISIKADVKSVSENQSHENLKKCRVQSKYAGKVTDVHKGVVYVRLTNGINAVAHSCYDRRMPGKKDDVSFAVTRIDEERGVAVGIITRIIKQNL
ncbi:MAG: S1 RNA-binding domain-containing protein [Clostridium sp.]|nr:S1 RNA-binding domain-containing protein [Clostridium sp.]